MEAGLDPTPCPLPRRVSIGHWAIPCLPSPNAPYSLRF